MPGRQLPGADKYRSAEPEQPAPWRSPIVEKANREVAIEDVLNDHFGMHVPRDAEGWKARCPLAIEHDDGGLDRQFRIYPSTNSGYCFAMHGALDPVRLWRLRRSFATVSDAAEDLLSAYGIDFRPRPYPERMAALRERPAFRADPDVLVQTINVFLAAHPAYEQHQYDKTVLRYVNSVLTDARTVCAEAESLGEVHQWLLHAQEKLNQILRSPTS